MMQLVPRWKVSVIFANHEDNVTVWIADTHLSNVLRTVAGMSFHADTLKEPIEIRIGPSDVISTQTGSTHNVYLP